MDLTNLSRTAGKKYFISTLNSVFKESPLASNVVIGLILAGLEKLVEMEFACPCDPKWNTFFAFAYFICPALTASLMKLCTGGCKYKIDQDCKKSVLNSLVPAIMWWILLFLDGQYYACGKTGWSGRFVIVDKAAPQKWCEPTNTTSSQELMIQTQKWFFHSQAMGIGILLLSGIVFGVCKCCKFFTTKQEDQEEEGEPMLRLNEANTYRPRSLSV